MAGPEVLSEEHTGRLRRQGGEGGGTDVGSFTHSFVERQALIWALGTKKDTNPRPWAAVALMFRSSAKDRESKRR